MRELTTGDCVEALRAIAVAAGRAGSSHLLGVEEPL
jgi:hypothetical protein